jgi:hypothetical protein
VPHISVDKKQHADSYLYNGEKSVSTFFMKKVENEIMTGAMIISGTTYFLL